MKRMAQFLPLPHRVFVDWRAIGDKGSGLFFGDKINLTPYSLDKGSSLHLRDQVVGSSIFWSVHGPRSNFRLLFEHRRRRFKQSMCYSAQSSNPNFCVLVGQTPT